MKRRPSIKGQKSKSIRIDPTGLALFREELKGDPEWEEYAAATDSELVVLMTMFARLHIQPDVFTLTSAAVQTLVDEAIRLNIGEVARALGGVAQLNPGYDDHRRADRGRLHRNIQREAADPSASVGVALSRWPTRAGKRLSGDWPGASAGGVFPSLANATART